jgi:GT2 family glycosyltransferase
VGPGNVKDMVNVSIVLFNNKVDQISRVLNSVLGSDKVGSIFLVDNSPCNSLSIICKNFTSRVKYIHNNVNSGYGAANNIAINKTISEGVKYHIVVNPDIVFESNIIDHLHDYMEANDSVGMMMPAIFSPDLTLQNLARLIPSPLTLIYRRLNPFYKNKYESIINNSNLELDVPFLSGCFMFLRIQSILDVGLFDENIFLYMEDVDLSRRINESYATVYYPRKSIIHEFNGESRYKLKALFIHITSAIYYFNKWGWLFDKKRKIINRKCINNLKKK